MKNYTQHTETDDINNQFESQILFGRIIFYRVLLLLTVCDVTFWLDFIFVDTFMLAFTLKESVL